MKTMMKTVWAILPGAIAFTLLTSCAKDSLMDVKADNSFLTGKQLESTEESAVLFSETQASGTQTSLVYDCINSFPLEAISEQEASALTQMREEELLAMDVYKTLYARYHVPVFNNISKSELQHTGAIRELLVKYDLPDIAVNHQTGVFVNQDLQTLYNALIAQGSVSVTAGLTVGATIEDLDINDLLNHITSDVDNADILFVFNELQKGSRNHLRSFYSLLEKRGVIYVPQFISAEYFNQIINSPHEIGSGCNG